MCLNREQMKHFGKAKLPGADMPATAEKSSATPSTVPFLGLRIMQVDAGTTVKDERTGETVTVDDETAAVKGRVIFCTKRVFDGLKAHAALAKASRHD